MKIKPEHFEYMRTAIHARQLPALAPNAKDPAMRQRWDALYAAQLSKWVGDHIYCYANDTHIDTALRAIVASHINTSEVKQS